MTMEEEEKMIADAIRNHIYEMSVDQQGTHIIEKILNVFTSERKQFIIEEVLDKFIELSNNVNGVCVAKKVIPLCLVKNSKYQQRILEIISKSSLELIQNPYGNYALQIALDFLDPSQSYPILDSFKGKYGQLSLLKFSSNVIEKCFEKADKKRKNEILKELTATEDKIICNFNSIIKYIALLKNGYGNFVLQKAFDMSDEDTTKEIGVLVQNALQHITDKKTKAKWVQIIDNPSKLNTKPKKC